MTTLMPYTPPADVIARAGDQAAVVLTAAVMAEIEQVERAFELLPDPAPDTMAESDAVAVSAARLLRSIEASRVAVKAVPMALCRAIDNAAAGPTRRLEAVKREVERRHAVIRAEVEAKRRATEQARREAEERAHRAEQARLAAEREAAAKREAEERALASLAAAAAPEDAPALQAMAADHAATVEAEAARVRDLAHRETEAAAEAYIASLEAEVPQLPKTSTVVRTVRQVEVYDETAVPDQVGTVRLKTLNMPALRRLLLAGIEVPGARLVLVEQTGTRA